MGVQVKIYQPKYSKSMIVHIPLVSYYFKIIRYSPDTGMKKLVIKANEMVHIKQKDICTYLPDNAYNSKEFHFNIDATTVCIHIFVDLFKTQKCALIEKHYTNNQNNGLQEGRKYAGRRKCLPKVQTRYLNRK